MYSSKGHHVVYSLFGESHGPAIGMTIHGLPAGIKINDQAIQDALAKRKTGGQYASQRTETDCVEWVSGTLDGCTTGAALTFMIKNQDQRSKDYTKHQHVLRPSHSDYTARQKYEGYHDYRGGGMFSGRLTACLVVAGSLVRGLLEDMGLMIKSSITKLHDVTLPFDACDPNKKGPWLSCLKPPYREMVTQVLASVQSQGDSIGGIVHSEVTGMPLGWGEPLFYSLESVVSSWLYAIPGLKGVSFGDGFDFHALKGSQANDQMCMTGDQVTCLSNHNGGVLGGISNGMPLVCDVVFKPTPSIYQPQTTVDIQKSATVEHVIEGRHDPAFVIRTPIVVESVIAMALYDLSRMAMR